MIETPGIVSWDSPMEQGKLPDSDWVYPLGDLDTIEGIDHSGEEITDADLRVFADGRSQHLELVRFPEGYQAARVIDSETGETVETPGRTQRYGGTVKRVERGRDSREVDVMLPVLFGRAISLGGGKELQIVDNPGFGTLSVVGPAKIKPGEPGFRNQFLTSMSINPKARELNIAAAGKARSIDSAHAKLEIRERDRKLKAELALWVGEGANNTGQLNLNLDTIGNITDLSVTKTGFLDALGVKLEPDFDDSNWADITDHREQATVLNALAEALGMERWSGLDLPLTALSLYVAIGQSEPDPAACLVPQS